MEKSISFTRRVSEQIMFSLWSFRPKATYIGYITDQKSPLQNSALPYGVSTRGSCLTDPYKSMLRVLHPYAGHSTLQRPLGLSLIFSLGPSIQVSLIQVSVLAEEMVDIAL